MTTIDDVLTVRGRSKSLAEFRVCKLTGFYNTPPANISRSLIQSSEHNNRITTRLKKQPDSTAPSNTSSSVPPHAESCQIRRERPHEVEIHDTSKLLEVEMSPAMDSRSSADTWFGVQDARRRKVIQNRLAQRARRK